MATFIDQVRCGECEAGLTLERASVVVQQYRRQPWLQHFWVRCDICQAHKLYWPTPRQIRRAGLLRCRTLVDDNAPDDVAACYARSNRVPLVNRQPVVEMRQRELGLMLSMLAALSGPRRAPGPLHSYLPPHWAN